MKIVGPRITKDVLIPEHTVQRLDEDAYWHLNWQGNEDPEGGFLYAKVAFPSLADAQRQHRLEATQGQTQTTKPRRQYRKRRPQ